MSKSRRNVRFPHRPNGAERRLSLSEMSDGYSEPNSAGKNGTSEMPSSIAEEVSNATATCALRLI